MSVQNRLLLIYTTIFTTAFLLVALLVYFLPINRILTQTDQELEEIAAQVSDLSVQGPADMARVVLPEDLTNFKTGSIFMIVVNAEKQIVARSGNMLGVDLMLDPNGFANMCSHSDQFLTS